MIIALIYTVKILSEIFFYLMLARCILSWIPQLFYSKIGMVIQAITNPVLTPCKKLLGKIEFLRNLPIDLSPILAILAVGIIEKIIVALLVTIVTF